MLWQVTLCTLAWLEVTVHWQEHLLDTVVSFDTQRALPFTDFTDSGWTTGCSRTESSWQSHTFPVFTRLLQKAWIPSRPPEFHLSTRARIGPQGSKTRAVSQNYPVREQHWHSGNLTIGLLFRGESPYTNSACESGLQGFGSLFIGVFRLNRVCLGKTRSQPIKQRGILFTIIQSKLRDPSHGDCNGSKLHQIQYSWSSLSEMG